MPVVSSSSNDSVGPCLKYCDKDTQFKSSLKGTFLHASSSKILTYFNKGGRSAYTIVRTIEPNWKTASGDAVLHLLCLSRRENIELLELYLQWSNLVPDITNTDGNTALHLACKHNKPNVVRILVTKVKCRLNIKNHKKKVPLELTENLEIITTLIKHGAILTPELILKFVTQKIIPKHSLAELIWNPDIRNSDGNTALHLACKRNQQATANYLLSQVHCDPNLKNNNNEVPLQMTTNKPIIKDLIRYGAQTGIMYKSYKRALGRKKPIKPPVKIFVVGNPSVGKSSLTSALKKELNFMIRMFTTGIVSGVDTNTVGIVPHDIKSVHFGRVTLYDFAGHREFYSGHAAFLQAAVQSSPPVFLLLVNLCEKDDKILQNILYWISFLENQFALVTCKPHIIIVGSHADTLQSQGVNPQNKVNALCGLLHTDNFINLELMGFIAMDCQRHESAGMKILRSLLVKSCKHLRIKEPITFNAHCLLVYLIDSFPQTPAVTIGNIHDHIQRQKIPHKKSILQFLPKSFAALNKICVELNDRGHVLFLRDIMNIEKSYVVINKNSMLAEVSGTVFAPESFVQHKQLANNTGVVSLSNFSQSFPDHDDIKLLIGFLSHLEFCHEISDQALFQLISGSYSPDERYYLFPGLISARAKESVWKTEVEFKYHFGWILQCTEREQFFSSRFLQVLLLRLAFSHALKSSSDDNSLAIHRKCSLWKNGIFWGRYFQMDMLVETIDSKSVIVMARFGSKDIAKCTKQRSQVLKTILDCVQEFCPRISTVESLLNISTALEYPLPHLSDQSLCKIQDLAEAWLSNCDSTCVVLSASGNCLPVESFISFEPYSEIEVATLMELWDENNAEKVIPDVFLSRLVEKISKNLKWLVRIFNESAHIPSSRDSLIQEIVMWRDNTKHSPMTYKQLRKKLDEHSIFAGRNNIMLVSNNNNSNYYECYYVASYIPAASTVNISSILTQ